MIYLLFCSYRKIKFFNARMPFQIESVHHYLVLILLSFDIYFRLAFFFQEIEKFRFDSYSLSTLSLRIVVLCNILSLRRVLFMPWSIRKSTILVFVEIMTWLSRFLRIKGLHAIPWHTPERHTGIWHKYKYDMKLKKKRYIYENTQNGTRNKDTIKLQSK